MNIVISLNFRVYGNWRKCDGVSIIDDDDGVVVLDLSSRKERLGESDVLTLGVPTPIRVYQDTADQDPSPSEFCYSSPTRLYYREHTLWSSQGVQQGDLHGPLLFSLVLHLLICKIRDTFSLFFHAWYLHDGTIVGDTLVVGKACRSFPPNIAWPMHGVKLLGGAVSVDFDFYNKLVMKRVAKTIVLMDSVTKANDPQWISASKEVDIGLDGRCDKPLRPPDILLYSWDGRLDVCVDLTRSSPLTQTGMVDFVHGWAIIDDAQCKRGEALVKVRIGHKLEGIGYTVMQTVREDSPIEVVAPPSKTKSKLTRGHQKRTVQNEDAP
uniref:Reverse transcriptase domain-containing protein n=1 Tax=Tanacetum cinerariifolium TaxID=118510 RepID=A0A6L2KTY4_TANCI|nr:hypothetical protein [Tanacetum cinerariifolium]